MSSLLQQLRRDYEIHDRSVRHLGLWAVWTYHYGRWALERREPVRWIASKIYGVLFLLVDIACGCHIHRDCDIGEDLHIIHSGNIKMHPRVRIGDRCGIMQDVIIGTNTGGDETPVLGDDVFVGPGAKVLGGVTIGDGARIGPNSVVLSDVPPAATAMGVPARVLKFRKKKQEGEQAESQQ